jgi:uncharacterized membrane protein YdbT with pleckstrin-like domain
MEQILSNTIDSINLKKHFPLAYRRALKRALWCDRRILPVLALLLAVSTGFFMRSEGGLLHQVLLILTVVTVVFVSLRWFFRFARYFIEQFSFQYRISDGNLILSKGIFAREVGSFPLNRITDIYLHREWGDFVWGLSCIQISTPTASSGQFAIIPGLSLNTAEALRCFLLTLIKV